MSMLNTFTRRAKFLLPVIIVSFTIATASAQRSITDFDKGWRFNLGDVPGAEKTTTSDAAWRQLNLPHDWSIEGKFSKDNKATPEGGALPGGIGWYRKTFTVPAGDKGKLLYI